MRLVIDVCHERKAQELGGVLLAYIERRYVVRSVATEMSLPYSNEALSFDVVLIERPVLWMEVVWMTT